MSGLIDKYGYDWSKLLVSEEQVWKRLQAMLSDKVLRFNPYTIDDTELLACAERGRMRSWPALTQMAVFHFHDIRQVKWKCPYDAIFYHVGDDPDESHMSLHTLTRSQTYTATRRGIHATVDGRKLTGVKDVERMQGHDYFVSHALMADCGLNRKRPVYRFFRLKGSDADKASVIRMRMIEAKIAMLQQVILYPYSPDYLSCSRDFIDYRTHILAYIEAVRRFPQALNISCDINFKFVNLP